MAIIRMTNNRETIMFRVFYDGTYIVGSDTTLHSDFAEKYITLRDAGFVEIK